MSDSSASSSGSSQPTPPAAPKFDSSAMHQQRPRLRPLRGFATQGQGPDGKTVPIIGLADQRQISDKVVFTLPAFQTVLPLMDGSRDLDQIVAQIGRGLARPMLEQLVAQLDDAALLEGPTFDALLKKSREEFDASAVLPPASSAQFADLLVNQAYGGNATEEQKVEEGPKKVRELFDKWMAHTLEKAENPSFDQLPKAIVAPHLDYGRGWMNYSAIYGRLRVCDRPDRVVILGTNHFGMGTGVVGCDKGYETPLGVCKVDQEMITALKMALGADGDKLFSNRFDHEREHSVELQIPWIQHVFGKNDAGEFPKVFGALVHDPVVNNGESYDGQGLSLNAFVEGLKTAISRLPGKTLIISSADLSHCGPAFGDPRPLTGDDQESEQLRQNILQQDLSLLEHIVNNKPQDLIGAMAWQQNPTRWCSTGNLVATMMAVEPKEVKMLNYAAAMDNQGITMVSSVAMVMW